MLFFSCEVFESRSLIVTSKISIEQARNLRGKDISAKMLNAFETDAHKLYKLRNEWPSLESAECVETVLNNRTRSYKSS